MAAMRQQQTRPPGWDQILGTRIPLAGVYSTTDDSKKDIRRVVLWNYRDTKECIPSEFLTSQNCNFEVDLVILVNLANLMILVNLVFLAILVILVNLAILVNLKRFLFFNDTFSKLLC